MKTELNKIVNNEHVNSSEIFKLKQLGLIVNFIQGIATYEPIPLTEEWFYKFGFSKSNVWFEKNGIELFNIADLYFRAKYPIKADVKFVHQLQNLYFALTGEELTVNN